MTRHWRQTLEHTLYTEDWKKIRNSKVITPESYDINPTTIEAKEIPKSTIDPIINNLRRETNNYSRFGSPLEEKLAEIVLQLEVGYVKGYTKKFGAMFFPSGMAAISNLINYLSLFILQENRRNLHFVAHKTLYPASEYFFKEIIGHIGFGETFFIDMKNEEIVSTTLALNEDRIVAVFYEPVSNPTLEYVDTRKVREIADWYDIPIIVDNTSLTPNLQQQFRLGADIVIHSLTKYASGKSDLTAGVVTGPKKFIEGCRNIQGITGDTLDLETIYKLCKRLPSLHSRMQQHGTSADKLAEYLKECNSVNRTFYPSLDSTRYNSSGGLVSFTVNEEKQKRLHKACITQGHKPIAVQVGFGSTNYRIIPGSYISKVLPKGFVRLSTGLTPVKEIVDFLESNL